jgi:hypothetical protein
VCVWVSGSVPDFGFQMADRNHRWIWLTVTLIMGHTAEFVCVCVWKVWLCVDKQKPGVVLELEWKGARVNLGAIARQLSRSYTS